MQKEARNVKDLCCVLHSCRLGINTSYLTDSYIGFTRKMESVSKNTIFGLKMMVKSGLEKIFLKFLHAGDYFPMEGFRNNFFSTTFHHHF